MKLTVIRLIREEDHTTGMLFIDGKYFCDTMEDKDRDLFSDMDEKEILSIKVFGETAIPYGTYKMRISYSPTFKKDLPEILAVKGFSGVRMHSGNYADYSTFLKTIPIPKDKKIFDIEENILIL